MNVSLTPELDKLVKMKVKSGLYNSASEVVREALRLLKSRDDLNENRINALRSDIQKGISSLDNGMGVEMTEELFNSIKKRGRTKLAEGKSQG
ncbi:MAG: type II toxin-antitoxin system ParD family antitoxin [Desulfofustis sp. PB-SRB1]|jgi:antitoxin ParD1/3/4|nr:type II toxin-antitoxin system ParD family antitoxin [Desulfofustis sp. PB-SRB1]MBM1001485.1 type II toxin-antitoxin system ParD family antitoxin [Desulfofustis sp. PB-SRB1]HBH28173.1 type II toxin-antitoxin system ParD family antitoxin [Desulfofustis sp.]HBH31364.1 type II toxin-antitoxin system ParD family antitoxin [Desulfofustis sp.]